MRTLVDPAREELTGLLQEIVRGSCRNGRDPRTVSHIGHGPGLVLGGDGMPSTDAAQRALFDVHRTELAHLMREAARAELGCSRSSPARLRAELREALRCATADRLRLTAPLRELVRACLAGDGPGGDDPGGPLQAVELAFASLCLEENLEGRRLLAAALSAGGDDAGASVVLATTVLSLRRVGEAIPRRRQQLIAELSLAQARAGERTRARRLARLADRMGAP